MSEFDEWLNKIYSKFVDLLFERSDDQRNKDEIFKHIFTSFEYFHKMLGIGDFNDFKSKLSKRLHSIPLISSNKVTKNKVVTAFTLKVIYLSLLKNIHPYTAGFNNIYSFVNYCSKKNKEKDDWVMMFKIIPSMGDGCLPFVVNMSEYSSQLIDKDICKRFILFLFDNIAKYLFIESKEDKMDHINLCQKILKNFPSLFTVGANQLWRTYRSYFANILKHHQEKDNHFFLKVSNI